MPPEWPDLRRLHAAVRIFSTNARGSYAEFVSATQPFPDFSVRAHREALHCWLNRWGCRIRYPRPGEEQPFDQSISSWWSEHGGKLPPRSVRLTRLSDAHIDALADAFDGLRVRLAASHSGRRRTIGPTAASKTLFAIRPTAVTAWDRSIARFLYGSPSREAFAAHLQKARTCARALLLESELTEDGLAREVEREGQPLSKLLDEYWYVTISRTGRRERERHA